MFENIGAGEVMLIFLVALIFFGPKKIPELAASLGKGLRKFNEAKEGLEGQIKTAMKEPMDSFNEAKDGLQKHLTDASANADISAPSAALPVAAVPVSAAPSAPVELKPTGTVLNYVPQVPSHEA